MRGMGRIVAAVIVAMLLTNVAYAVTADEIVRLSRAGVGEDLIIGLIRADGTIFTLDADTILDLKRQGVSERVVLAMLQSGRQDPAPAAELAPTAIPEQVQEVAPIVVVIGSQPPPPPSPLVVWPVPVYPVWHHRLRRPPDPKTTIYDIRGFGRFINDGFPRADSPPAPAAPVYWGWGGKLRPDAWGQPPPPKK